MMQSCCKSLIVPSFVKTQVRLTVGQARELKARARNEGRSVADLVRQSVTEYLARRPVRDRRVLLARASALSGRFHSGYPDVAENHDQHLAKAYDS